jgi:hypothetical protein
MGGNDEWGKDVPPRPGSPLIRLRSFAFMGGNDLYRVPTGLGDRSLRDVRRGVSR